MLITDAANDNDISYFLQPSLLSNIVSVFNELILSSEPGAQLFEGGWFYYQPEGDEYAYCSQIPGAKIIFRNEQDYDKATALMQALVIGLSKENDANVEFVLIDQQRLKELA